MALSSTVPGTQDDAATPTGGAETGGSSGHAARRLRLFLGVVVLGLVIGLVLRVHSAYTGFVSAFKHFPLGRLPLVAVAAAFETASLVASALVQRTLLGTGGFLLRVRTLLALVVASTAVVDLLPAGVAPANGWLVEQYRLRQAPLPLALWDVLAAGFASTVCLLALVLIGAGAAGVWSPVGLAVCGAVLVVGSSGFVVLVHRFAGRPRPAGPRRGSRLWAKVQHTVELAVQYRLSHREGVAVLAYSSLNWLLDAACLVLAFVMIGFPVPWGAVLFAYAGSQVLGGLSFLRLGVVEGGLVGAFVLTGVPVARALAATLMYRVFAYWLVSAVGLVVLVAVNRRQRLAGDLKGAPG